eukprot:403368414
MSGNKRKFLNQLQSISQRRVNSGPHKVPILQTPVEFIKNKNFRYYTFVSLFSCTYIYSLYKATHSENEILRVGAAGSITMLIGESTFYCIDAVNMRSKILSENVGFRDMIRRIYSKEGIYGLYKGYSASFYSSIFYGYLYFYIYKGLKVQMKERLDPQSTGSYALIYASASTIAEIVALVVYYPYELIKVRFLTKNDKYGYHSVSDAFVKIVRKDNVSGLYRGVFAFFLTFMGQYTLQMTCYELIIDKEVKALGLKEFQKHENLHVLKASVISGVIAALFTNSLEVIVVRQQSESGQTVKQIFQEEGLKLFTKGLGAKLMMTSFSSVLFFMSMNHIGKMFNTNLSEEKE